MVLQAGERRMGAVSRGGCEGRRWALQGREGDGRNKGNNGCSGVSIWLWSFRLVEDEDCLKRITEKKVDFRKTRRIVLEKRGNGWFERMEFLN